LHAAGEPLTRRNQEQVVSGSHSNQGLHGLTLVTKVATRAEAMESNGNQAWSKSRALNIRRESAAQQSQRGHEHHD
jgi:hypothetical protein